MTERRSSSSVESIDPAVVDRLAALHTPYPEAVAQGVDIISDPSRQDDDGYNWTRLRFARAVADVLPRSTVMIGSVIGRYPAKVIAWDFEVSHDDPIVTLENSARHPGGAVSDGGRATPDHGGPDPQSDAGSGGGDALSSGPLSEPTARMNRW